MATSAGSVEAGRLLPIRCGRTRSRGYGHQRAPGKDSGDQAGHADQGLHEGWADDAAESGPACRPRHAPRQPSHAHHADPHESSDPGSFHRHDGAGHEQAKQGKDPPGKQPRGFPRGVGGCSLARASHEADQHGTKRDQASQHGCAQGCGAERRPGRCGVRADAECAISEDPDRVCGLRTMRLERRQGQCGSGVEGRRGGIVPADESTEPGEAHDQRRRSDRGEEPR